MSAVSGGPRRHPVATSSIVYTPEETAVLERVPGIWMILKISLFYLAQLPRVGQTSCSASILMKFLVLQCAIVRCLLSRNASCSQPGATTCAE